MDWVYAHISAYWRLYWWLLVAIYGYWKPNMDVLGLGGYWPLEGLEVRLKPVFTPEYMTSTAFPTLLSQLLLFFLLLLILTSEFTSEFCPNLRITANIFTLREVI